MSDHTHEDGVECMHAGDEGYRGFRVTECFAFLQVDPNDDQEGSPTLVMAGGALLPMISFDFRHKDSLRPVAEQYAKQTGRRIRLVRFSQLEEVEVFEP